MSTPPIAKAPRGYVWSVKPFTMNDRTGFELELRKRVLWVFSRSGASLMFWNDATDEEVLEGAQSLISRVQ